MMTKQEQGYVHREQGLQDQWIAEYQGKSATYSVNRYGAAVAERLANRALLALRAGTHDPVREDALLRQTYDMDTSAQILNLHPSELRRWLLTGAVRGKEVTPPRKDTQRNKRDRFNGFELMIARERLEGIAW